MSVLVEKQDGCGLASVIGRLPAPGTSRIRRAKGGFHRRTQNCGVDPLATFEMRQQLAGGSEDGVGMLVI